MSRISDLCNEESFSSFLAGVLLTRRKISNLEFFTFLDDFQNKYNTCVIDDDINVLLDTNNGSISLVDDYDTIIMYENKKMTVREYLYLITSYNVREFFGLSSNSENFINIPVRLSKGLIKKRISV